MKYVLVLLNTNPNRPEIDKDSMERVQVGHLENMNRLYNEGKLVVSGPFGDKQAGGLFILKVPTLLEARDLLATDPAVRALRYAPEVFMLSIGYGKICTAPDIFSLAKFPFVQLVAQRSLTEEHRAQHDQYYRELAGAQKILFHGVLGNGDAIVIFNQSDDLTAASALVMADPAVKQVEIRPHVRLWWNAPGVFCEPTE